jgi:hypothetical protein
MNRFSLLSKLGPFALSLMLATVFAFSGAETQAATGMLAAPAPATGMEIQAGLAAVDAPPNASTTVQIQVPARAGGVAVAGRAQLAQKAIAALIAALNARGANCAA